MGERMFRKGLAVAVILLFIGVAFAVPINANMSKSSLDPVPDLDCEGSLDWVDIAPGGTVEGSFTVENIGDPTSLLDWGIESYPDWGNWTFDPESGTGLLAGDTVTIEVEVVAPDESEEAFTGEVVLVNMENTNDFCIIEIRLVINKQKSIDDATPIALVFQLIAKLRNHKDIQNVESEDDILQIIESDEELNSIYEQLSAYGCGCEDESTTELEFPIICFFFGFIDAILFIIWTMTGGHFYFLELALSTIDEIFNCNWA